MKKFTLLNTLLFSIFMILFVGFRTEGFFSAIFLRQDLPHFLVLVPFFIGCGVFMVSYQAINIDWKDLKGNWQNILSIIVSFLICLCLIFSTSFYMELTNAFQFSIIAIFLIFIFITTIINYLKSRKTIKEEK